MDVQILASGSSGNAVVINHNIMIDAGITIRDFKSHNLEDIDTLIISHAHGDHLQKPLTRHLLKKGVKAYFPASVIAKLIEEGMIDIPPLLASKQITPINDELIIKAHELTIRPLPQKHHDIVNYAFVFESDNHRLLYSTDLDTVEATDIGVGLLGQGMFDTILLEGNYDENYLREYIAYIVSLVPGEEHPDKFTNEELDSWVRSHYHILPQDVAQNAFRAIQNRRHLSKQQARAYAQTHLNEGGKYYEIHRSNMFYQKPEGWLYEN